MSDAARQFPVGPFLYAGPLADAARAAAIRELAAFPAQLAAACAALDAAGWETPYREGGWTPRQVVHHLADSHMNALIRVKLLLTEEAPTVKPYDEAAWARLPDVAAVDPSVSIALVTAVHARWSALLAAQPASAFTRTYFHPEHGRAWTLDEVTAMYAWHSRHHLAHIRLVLADRAA